MANKDEGEGVAALAVILVSIGAIIGALLGYGDTATLQATCKGSGIGMLVGIFVWFFIVAM